MQDVYVTVVVLRKEKVEPFTHIYCCSYEFVFNPREIGLLFIVKNIVFLAYRKEHRLHIIWNVNFQGIPILNIWDELNFFGQVDVKYLDIGDEIDFASNHAVERAV